jgi:dihydrofolate synthase/folylpolyglutamate synthase
MRQLMDFLGNPQDRYKVVHVAGTSGKTSTAYFAAAFLHAAGKKVGLTVSPHVDYLNERVQIGMVPLHEAVFVREMNLFLELVDTSGLQPMYFELLCAFAFWEFARQGVEYAVVEVGVGGLLDNTNVMRGDGKVCVLTDIGYDHMSVLGNTLPEIAAQKAGIVQLHNTVFCWQQDQPVLAVFSDVAHKRQADLHVLQMPVASLQVDFLPLFQRRNCMLAYTAVQFVLQRDGGKLSPEATTLATHTYIPARMECQQLHGRTVVIDGAHNPQKLHALMQSVHAQYPGKQVAVLAGFANSKRPKNRADAGARALAQDAAHIILTAFTVNRLRAHSSMKPEAIAATFDMVGYTSYEIIIDPTIAFQALLNRPEPVLVVAGSFYLLNVIRPLLRAATASNVQ